MKQSTSQWLTILGATGSIGMSALDVISRNPDRYRVHALTANTQVDRLFQQCCQFNPRFAVMADCNAATKLKQRLQAAGSKTAVLSGPQALIEVAEHQDVDVILAAIVGAAGLVPTLAAIKTGKRILLANKEALVMSGALFMEAVKTYHAELIPVDSEHNAIFQCMPPDYQIGQCAKEIKAIVLTASGGPFLRKTTAEMTTVTPLQALAHPNWKMGPKVTIDSATMMNKGLEVVEAHWLFQLPLNQIEVIIHPQSVIHSMVRYHDGSVLAQMGAPDMRTPIATALAWPNRIAAGVADLDLLALGMLNFEPVDLARFPCLQIVYQALLAGDASMTIVNAANEVAVVAFLQQSIGFIEIANVIDHVLQTFSVGNVTELEQILAIDQRAREVASGFIEQIKNKSNQIKSI